MTVCGKLNPLGYFGKISIFDDQDVKKCRMDFFK